MTKASAKGLAFLYIDGALLRRTDLTAEAKLVLGAVTIHITAGTGRAPSMAFLAEELGLSHRAIRRNVRRLVKTGGLLVSYSQGRRNLYSLPKSGDETSPVCGGDETSSPPGTKRPYHQGRNVPSSGDETSPATKRTEKTIEKPENQAGEAGPELRPGMDNGKAGKNTVKARLGAVLEGKTFRTEEQQRALLPGLAEVLGLKPDDYDAERDLLRAMTTALKKDVKSPVRYLVKLLADRKYPFADRVARTVGREMRRQSAGTPEAEALADKWAVPPSPADA
jgi:biotin operon repressor